MHILLRALFDWNVPQSSLASLKEAEVIVSHEFGDQHQMGIANSTVVTVVARLQNEYGLPWIAQFPQNTTLKAQSPVAVIESHQLSPGAYLDTEEVNRQIAAVCKERRWKTVMLCAHPDHAWRAGKNLERHGLQVRYPDLSSIPYDPACAKLAARSKYIFITREIFVRVYYWFKGYF